MDEDGQGRGRMKYEDNVRGVVARPVSPSPGRERLGGGTVKGRNREEGGTNWVAETDAAAKKLNNAQSQSGVGVVKEEGVRGYRPIETMSTKEGGWIKRVSCVWLVWI